MLRQYIDLDFAIIGRIVMNFSIKRWHDKVAFNKHITHPFAANGFVNIFYGSIWA